jgi:hypothetical protein
MAAVAMLCELPPLECWTLQWLGGDPCETHPAPDRPKQPDAKDITGPSHRRTDPVTSRLAAKTARGHAETNRALALEVLRSHPGGLTDFELAEITGFQQTSIGKRRGELRDAGLVVNSGRRRRTPSGSEAIVWKAV